MISSATPDARLAENSLSSLDSQGDKEGDGDSDYFPGSAADSNPPYSITAKSVLSSP